MVRGLFPTAEQEVVLAMLARSLVFLTPDTIEAVLNKEDPRTAWDLANIHLLSCGAELLADDAPRAVGMSVGTTCFVSMDHFCANHRFADFVVHEAAHVFHNCKRRTLGLPEKRGRREWLLEIDFSKREAFAYACEAYSRILGLADGPHSRRKLYQELESGPLRGNGQACVQDYLEAVRAAVAARNGWKHILYMCAPPWARRTRSQDQPA
jgi:hypothetical protein